MRAQTKKRSAKRRLLACRVLRRLARKQDGSAAVEFGLVGWPFIMLLFAIMETALVFWAGQTLETAVADSGRLIMTGQAQSQGLNQAAFKTAICNKLQGGLFNCDNIYVDVQTKPTFQQFEWTAPFAADGTFEADKVGYQPGGPDSIVLVRAYYQWPLYVALPGSNRLLVATAAFRNEPYDAGGAAASN